MTKHLEDQVNKTLLIARKIGDQLEMSWPDDLGLARYLWRKLGTNIEQASYLGWPTANDPDTLAVESLGDTIVFELPDSESLARYLYAGLGGALDDKEWAAFQQVKQLQAQMMKNQTNGVKIEDARVLKSLKGRRN